MTVPTWQTADFFRPMFRIPGIPGSSRSRVAWNSSTHLYKLYAYGLYKGNTTLKISFSGSVITCIFGTCDFWWYDMYVRMFVLFLDLLKEKAQILQTWKIQVCLQCLFTFIYLSSLKLIWKFYTSCTLLAIERGTFQTHPFAENEVPSHRMLQLFQVVFRHHALRSLAFQAEPVNRLRGTPTATVEIESDPGSTRIPYTQTIHTTHSMGRRCIYTYITSPKKLPSVVGASRSLIEYLGLVAKI